MALLKLKLPPTQAGYSVKDGQTVVSVALDGGASRQRQDVLGAAAQVAVSWTVGAFGYEYLRAFYALTGMKGLPFLADLLLDQAGLLEYEARFAPNTFQLSRRTGRAYTVEAALEVTPQPPDDALAQDIVDIFDPADAALSGPALDGVLDGTVE